MSNSFEKEEQSIVERVREFLDDLIDLREGVDVEGTIIQINANKSMQGANAWTLMCSIMIASLGLDLNSAAVIIGAMLISPLMSPILGVGLGVAMNDREMLLISMRHWGVSIAIALITSLIYFAITPLGDATPEILARTKPTLLDGLIAIFGGLAGSISTTRKDQSNAVPGVAIATALMPPLCVAGYGLAAGNWTIFINAFYLFFLNSFFVALTAYFVFRLLRFPNKAYADPLEQKRSRWAIMVFSLLLIIPSIFILRDVWTENQSQRAAADYVNTYFGERQNPSAVDYNLVDRDTAHTLYVKLIGQTLPEDTIQHFQRKLASRRHLTDTELILIQDSDLEMSYIEKMETDIKGVQAIADQLVVAERAKTMQEKEIESLQLQLDIIRGDTIPFQSIVEELKIIFPEVTQIAYAKAQWSGDDTDKIPTVIVQWKKGTSSRNKANRRIQLEAFLEKRCNKEEIILVER